MPCVAGMSSMWMSWRRLSTYTNSQTWFWYRLSGKKLSENFMEHKLLIKFIKIVCVLCVYCGEKYTKGIGCQWWIFFKLSLKSPSEELPRMCNNKISIKFLDTDQLPWSPKRWTQVNPCITFVVRKTVKGGHCRYIFQFSEAYSIETTKQLFKVILMIVIPIL